MKIKRPEADAPSPRHLDGERKLLMRQLVESAEIRELKTLAGLAMAMFIPGDEPIFFGGVAGGEANPVCWMIHQLPEGVRRCEACDRKHHSQAATDGKPRMYTCHAGLCDMVVPIVIQGEHVANVTGGQVFFEQPTEAGFARLRRRLRWMNAPEKTLRRAYFKAPWMSRDRLAHVLRLLEIFLRQMCNSAWRIRQLEANMERPEIRKAKAIVEEQFRDAQLQISDVAAEVGLSMAHFSHLFHKETGITFTRHVRKRRIAVAKRMLAETDQTILSICFSCGFNSLTHFYRVFRSEEGGGPRKYRRASSKVQDR